MKKWIAILLLCTYIFGATDAYQLLKIPALVNHYIQHKSGDRNITLMAFLKMHYEGGIKIDADFQKDMQLPFKTHETECCISIATVLPAPIQLLHKTEEPIQREYTILNDEVPEYANPQGVFQPPKA
ncbi:hypothetical protein [Limnovirga soli]|uniref:Uncharacterized protein n=1 Tax=Limnovirga soli TaxID=2656915 RepID=A0A8J8FEE9_9BACT|nr:hypothetical protein [Limnovirga soli]NNV55208.1 hypothetical protein [Limnovirga soli]